MKTTTKIVTALAAVGILGFGALAVAQPAGGCDGYMSKASWRGGKFDPAERAEQHLSRLKTDLKLTAAQEPLWQAFADNAKAEAGKGMTAMRDIRQDLSLSAPERLARHTQAMKERLAAMEAVSGSFNKLYAALSPEQKRVADIHAARIGPGGSHGHRHFGRDGFGRGQGGPAGSQPAPEKG